MPCAAKVMSSILLSRWIELADFETKPPRTPARSRFCPRKISLEIRTFLPRRAILMIYALMKKYGHKNLSTLCEIMKNEKSPYFKGFSISMLRRMARSVLVVILT